MIYNKKGEHMTSEKALWDLMHKAIKTYNKEDIFRLNIIKKDLEIAQILKNSMSVETETFENDNNEVEEYEYIAFNDWDLDIENKEEYNKVREWLKEK